jgi:cyclic pyranopterin phosphate synthase
LRGCLLTDDEIDIKTPLRQGKGDDHLFDLIKSAILNKPRDHGLGEYKPRKCVRSMNSIGG